MAHVTRAHLFFFSRIYLTICICVDVPSPFLTNEITISIKKIPFDISQKKNQINQCQYRRCGYRMKAVPNEE